MIIPSKHEKLNESLIALGSEILNSVKRKNKLVEDLFNEFKVKHPNIHLDNFFLTLVFLWLIGAIKKEGDLITYK
ncbi:hypothetical protein KAJ87_00585 [Candidatus Pacearchaeota archaeon]|nr:hypothetical protein [Candidatus Pacearchaeota archaeon]